MTRVGRGKEVDHLYKDRQLIFADASQKIWFIGDSKYYKEKNDIVGESVYKQFTYARNIIQYNINDLLKGDGQNGEGVLRYRDPLTEGYSVTPNFFIRGEVDKGNPCEIPATGDAIKKDGADMWAERNRHFENRLFDRDTLLLQVYDVNFLYVLKAFTAKSSGMREEFKVKARKMFREKFLELLDKRYYFWAVFPKVAPDEKLQKLVREWNVEASDSLKAFVWLHSRTLAGKIFMPYGFGGLVLALEKASVDENKPEFTKLKTEIDGDCEVFRITPEEIWNLEDKRNPGWDVKG